MANEFIRQTIKKNMNNKITYLLFAIIITFNFGISQAGVQTYSAAHEEVQMLFQSNEEKTTKDALWTAHDIFKVGVLNDGYNRNGYASYVCQVLYDYGFKGKDIWVQVIDIVKLTRKSKWVKLGEAYCQ